ncbi:NADPH-dependent FMN reductase [Azoarcus indigens]|uniref:Flavoprotein WrbA n=1 Tax=Azoarcus indigens TaxID=29545 RepID=A0A4R6DXJ5_9RHOO|nr:flavodoxin family protein [Azoarcus indigens]NMG65576.1 NADPH-dependent FMN reductase [Azoarcus indigens]TDN50017.1 multimeric flavodoxin WrbA [Azoarcus indigens]
MTSSVSIVFHSGHGHTAKVAQAVAEGCDATLLAIDEHGCLPPAGWEQLAAARAIVFGSPTYMGSVSWQFKKFMDASSSVWARQGWKDKLAAGFTNSAGINGDKLATLHTFFTLSQQHGMLWAGTGMMPSNAKAARRGDVNYLASFAGLMTATPVDATPDEMIAGDLDTARLFGRRIADVVRRMN